MMSAMTSLLLVLATIVTGLYAGFMLTFLTGIMPGLADLTDEQFAAAMRRFNEKVPGRSSWSCSSASSRCPPPRSSRASANTTRWRGRPSWRR